MRKLTMFLVVAGFSVLSHAERYDVYVHEPIQSNNAALMGNSAIDFNGLSSNFAEGQNIRKAWDARKARKNNEQAMKELGTLDLNDNNAVMSFAKKYPDSIDNLKDMLQLQKQLSN